MNKMIVNAKDKLFVTSDAATIIKELDVIHPAAKMIVMASQRQEEEVQTIYIIDRLALGLFY
jgi:T-complex protein 1 subunit theta